MKFNKKYIGKIFRDFLTKKSNQISKNKTEIKNLVRESKLYEIYKINIKERLFAEKINFKNFGLQNLNSKKLRQIFSKDGFNNLQDKVEVAFKKITFDESLLKQSDFWLKSVTWALVGTSTFGLAWLGLAKTDEVVMAIGKLEPKGDVKEIQIPIGGVIDEILVKSGDKVQKDQILVQLDKETTFEEFKALEYALVKKELQLEKNLSILNLKNSQIEQESSIISEQIRNAKEKKEINSYLLTQLENLHNEGGISKFQYLEQKMKHSEVISDLSKLTIERDRKLNILAQEIEQLESDQARIRSEIVGLKSKLIGTSVTLKYQSLKAPVSGIIFDLKPTTEGYVAQSSEPIMKIVPFNDLEADIEIPSNKIGFVKVGMPVEINIDSFPSSDFGVLNGKIKSIGSDALVPSQLEQRPDYRYPAIVELDTQKLELKNGKSLPLQVGMSLSTNIKLRKVSYLKLLLGGFSRKVDSLKNF